MLSSDSVKEIANIFCGDIGDYYTYKSELSIVYLPIFTNYHEYSLNLPNVLLFFNSTKSIT